MRPTLLLLQYFFLADQRMAYQQSTPGPTVPRPAALIAPVAAFAAGLLPGFLTIVLGSDSLVYDSFLTAALAYVLLLFPAGLIAPTERDFLSVLPATQKDLRRFEFAHSLLTGLYVGLPIALPAAFFVYYTSGERQRALGLLAAALLGYYIITFAYGSVFQLPAVRSGRIPIVVVSFLVAALAALLIVAPKLRGAGGAWIRAITPGASFSSLGGFLAGKSEALSIGSFGILVLFISLAFVHWRLSGQKLISYRAQFKSRPSMMSRAALRLSEIQSRRREFGLIGALLLIHAWRAPRFNLLLFLQIPLVLLYPLMTIRVAARFDDVILNFWFLNAMTSAIVYSLCISSYDRAPLPLPHLFGASARDSVRAALGWSTLSTLCILFPTLIVSMVRAGLFQQLPAGLIWVALQVYASHLLMQTIYPRLPLSFPLVRTGNASLFISNLVFCLAVGMISTMPLFSVTHLLRSSWMVIGSFGLLAAILRPLVYRLSERKLRFIHRSTFYTEKVQP